MAPEIVNRARLRNYLIRLELRAWVETLDQGLLDLERVPAQYQNEEFRRIHSGIVGVIADVTAMIERLRADSGKAL